MSSGPDVVRTRGRLDQAPLCAKATSLVGSTWSPEQIARRLPLEYSKDQTMRIVSEVIYQALFSQGRGVLCCELITCLHCGRALRVPRARRKGKRKPFICDEIMISECPAEGETGPLRGTGRAI